MLVEFSISVTLRLFGALLLLFFLISTSIAFILCITFIRDRRVLYRLNNPALKSPHDVCGSGQETRFVEVGRSGFLDGPNLFADEIRNRDFHRVPSTTSVSVSGRLDETQMLLQQVVQDPLALLGLGHGPGPVGNAPRKGRSHRQQPEQHHCGHHGSNGFRLGTALN